MPQVKKLVRSAGTAAAIAATLTFNVSGEIDKLQERRQKHADKCDELVAKMTAEDRSFTDDEQKAYNEEKGNAEQLKARIAILEERAADQADSRGRSRTAEDPETRNRQADNDDDGPTEDEKREEKAHQKEYRGHFRDWVRHGELGLSPEGRSMMRGFRHDEEGKEGRALSAVTGSAGGYTVPQGFNDQIVEAMSDYSGVLKANVSKLTTQGGNDIPWPTVNDTAQSGELLAENTAAASQDVVFSSVTLKGYVFSSKIVLVPLQLLEDTGIEIEPILAALLGARLGRSLNSYFTTGTGTAQPQGVVTFATSGVTAAAVAAITYGETIDLQHSVDPAYRSQGKCQYMFHDTTFKLLRKLLDSDGRPIWQPQATAGAGAMVPPTLNGDGYVINQNMAVPATAAKSMLYGDFRNYKVRQIRGVTLLQMRERYAEYLQVGFLAHCRFDGRGVNAGTNPIKYLAQA